MKTWAVKGWTFLKNVFLALRKGTLYGFNSWSYKKHTGIMKPVVAIGAIFGYILIALAWIAAIAAVIGLFVGFPVGVVCLLGWLLSWAWNAIADALHEIIKLPYLTFKAGVAIVVLVYVIRSLITKEPIVKVTMKEK